DDPSLRIGLPARLIEPDRTAPPGFCPPCHRPRAHANMDNPMPALSNAQLAQFIADGFVRIDNAFPETLAAECRDILWADTGVDPDNPATWTKPVIRLGNYGQQPFRDAANTPILHEAFDQLVGP